MRTYDKELIRRALSQYADEIEGLDLDDWIANPLNIARTNEDNDVVLFEHQELLVNTVCAHYFLFSRGRKAIDECKKFLKDLFQTTYVEVITGLTPEHHKAALWMNRQLGCTEHGVIETVIGPCKFVVLTKQKWKDSET